MLYTFPHQLNRSLIELRLFESSFHAMTTDNQHRISSLFIFRADLPCLFACLQVSLDIETAYSLSNGVQNFNT